VSTLVLRAFAFFAGLLAWGRAQRLGAVLGLVWFYVVRIRRRVVFSNLSKALPSMRSEHEKIAREAYRHFGMSAMEFLQLRSIGPDGIARLIRTRGMEHYDAAKASGRGIVVVTAHFGNFDLLACSQAASGIPLAIVSRDLHQNGIGRFWMETRESSGLKIFPDKGAAKQVLSWLKSGRVLGLTVDQRTSPERGGILSDFMGLKAWTTTAPAELALRTGAAILPVRIERRLDGNHDVVVEAPIQMEGRPNADGVKALTRQINEVVETWIYNRPEHWMWLHRRFADYTKPELESAGGTR
jgi:KDO2-lipid IV(A) lauroyltransferase